MSDTETAPVGLQLPPYEVDFLGWLAAIINGQDEAARLLHRGPEPRAEIEIGENAILVRFPSGGERTLFVDPRPHGESVMLNRMRMEELAERADKAESELSYAEGELSGVRDDLNSATEVIDDARKLLEAIEADERTAELPEWLLDRVESAIGELNSPL